MRKLQRRFAPLAHGRNQRNRWPQWNEINGRIERNTQAERTEAMTHPICPECSTRFVKRAHRVSLQERVLSLVYVDPFRCQLCGHRFRFLHWGIKYLRVEEDRRTYERLAINFPVTFTSDSIESKGSVADISIAGCKMQAGVKMVPGAILSMSLQISDGVPAVAVQAAVVRDVRRNGVGVEFLQLKKTERDRLRDFIRNLFWGDKRARQLV